MARINRRKLPVQANLSSNRKHKKIKKLKIQHVNLTFIMFLYIILSFKYGLFEWLTKYIHI